MTAVDTINEIDRRLRAALQPTQLALIDDSAKHAGHAGAASGGGHFQLRIVSARFAGLGRVARHRLVYDSLSGLMRNAIHALAIEALAPDEAPDGTAASPSATGPLH